MAKEMLIAALFVICLAAAGWFLLVLDAQPNGQLRAPVKMTGTIVELGTALSLRSQAKSPNDIAIEVRLANGQVKKIRTSLPKLSGCRIGSKIALERIGVNYRLSDKACNIRPSEQ